MSYKHSVQKITVYKADWWMASDVGALLVYCTTTSQSVYTLAKLNHLQLCLHNNNNHRVIYCTWKQDISVTTSTPKINEHYKRREKWRRGTLQCYLSRAWRQSLEAITLFIGKHKHVLVMAIRWHPAWRQKMVTTEGKYAFGEYCCLVDFHLKPHFVPWGGNAVFSCERFLY